MSGKIEKQVDKVNFLSVIDFLISRKRVHYIDTPSMWYMRETLSNKIKVLQSLWTFLAKHDNGHCSIECHFFVLAKK